ncbi:winged helix-turn-helix transcriptional regulator [Mycobacterium sp. 663a-19]|uniref:winged helix-turn-helix transcriptional regulator n=1 Tax=Mycobacterium sp. 663a-19 TaxID=2986148 RepID=UPI002D1E81A0|nr:winged helix-turn-helix transcriptional regulator [Mycobacterium sp. 663a-19]MEB3980402.1 winged helix-turn-helix transcriptional regulator [Mycobacterium sp. 663a-19]
MRSYQQFCPTARALDLVGERWTLLIVRELLFGPKRYTDLQDGLPGIGPNVLAARLQSMEANGLIRKRRLPPPAASTVYELTERGDRLRQVVRALFEWGLDVIGTPGAHDTVKASYWLPAVQAAVHAQSPPADIDDEYEFRVADEAITVTVKAGKVDVRQGPADRPGVVMHTDTQTFAGLGSGRITPAAAIEAGTLTLEGDPAAARRCAELFGLSDGQPSQR